jgi:hypothetical protein
MSSKHIKHNPKGQVHASTRYLPVHCPAKHLLFLFIVLWIYIILEYENELVESEGIAYTF